MQHEIKCPNCGKVFTIDEASYAGILNQVKNEEFDKELENRLSEAAVVQKQMAENAVEKAKAHFESELGKKEQEMAKLKSELAVSQADNKVAIMEAVAKITKERDKLKSELDSAEQASISREVLIRQSYKQQLQDRDEIIERLKDMKAKMSTKMVGESLEQHCQNEFNAIRATAFPRAEFGKDNTVSASGSKGDFIFRDFDENGVEIVSIMFEMKNENDTTATKHKNEHFFKELDKDRNEKGCEYAVLVSLLESENEFYNRGIVDVSYEYPKMYVIRPQFFLTLIGLITNTARNALEYKRELAVVKNQNIDVTNFESKLNDFKNSFALNSERASKNFNKAIEDIDKSIKYLEDTKEALIKTIKNFGTANNKLEDLTVKRLTRGNPTMTAMFEEAGE